jgi:soluble lytic murein transglycosylase-like protein
LRWRNQFGALILFLVAAAACARAGDLARLKNGFALPYVHKEVRGGLTRLYQDQGDRNFVDVPSDQITAFEHEDDPPAPPAAAPAGNSGPDAIQQAVSAASQQQQVDPDFIHSVIRAESGYNPRAVSPKGAQGLMQLMPKTAAQLGVAHPFDPAANVQGGTLYLRQLLEQYHGDPVKALAAYNAGPERVTRYHGIPPFPETQAYVARVIRDFNRKKAAQAAQQKTAAKPAPAKPPASKP